MLPSKEFYKSYRFRISVLSASKWAITLNRKFVFHRKSSLLYRRNFMSEVITWVIKWYPVQDMNRALPYFMLISLSPIRTVFDHLVKKNYIISNSWPMVNFLTSDRFLWIWIDSCTASNPHNHCCITQNRFRYQSFEKLYKFGFWRHLMIDILMTS